MKLSEMTNDKLADLITKGCGSSLMGRAIREAAERLRLKQRSDDYAAALCRKESEYKCEICDLRAKLKIASAPKLCECLREAINDKCHFCNASEDERRELCDQCIVADWKDALAEAEGEAKPQTE